MLAFRGISAKTAGFSLLEVMLAMSIMGVVAAGFVKMLSTAFKGSAKIQNYSDIDSIKYTVLAKNSCVKTLAAAGGSCSGMIEFRDHSDAVWMSATAPRYFGKFALRGLCSGTDLSVEVSMLKPGEPISASADSSFYADPLTLQPMRWRSLFVPGVYPCKDGGGDDGGGGGSAPTPVPTVVETATPTPLGLASSIQSKCVLKYPATVTKSPCGITGVVSCNAGETLLFGGAPFGANMALQRSYPTGSVGGPPTGWLVTWYAVSGNCGGINSFADGTTRPGNNPCFGTYCGGVSALCCSD